MKKLTKKQVDVLFIEEYMPSIRETERKQTYTGRVHRDIPLRCESYNNFIDYLHKDGAITDKQVSNFSIPSHLVN